jgi:hypothetical protein
LPLLEYRPLEGNQLREFKPNTSLLEMQTGRCPWLGMSVDIIKGEFKGQHGAVKDVNCYKPDPLRAENQSGIMLTVERYVITASSSILVKLDYNAVCYHKYVFSSLFFGRDNNKYHRTNLRLCDVFMPTPRQSFYIPNDVQQIQLAPAPYIHGIKDGGNTPRPTDLERETIFTGVWSPGDRTPTLSPSSTPGPASPPHVPDSPLSLLLPEPPAPHISSAFEGHWVLDPKLVGIPIQVDINSGELDTSRKKAGIFVETVAGTDGNIIVTH